MTVHRGLGRRALRIARRDARLKRRRLIVVGSTVLALIVLIVGTATIRQTNTRNVLMANNGSQWSATQSGVLKVNEVYNFGIWFGNTSPDTTVTLDSVTFPNGIPAHVHLYAIRITEAKYLSGDDWPPQNANPASLPKQFVVGTLFPVAGYHLAPGQYITLIVSATADKSGTYVVGPVTVHAKVPGLFDSVLGEVPIERTYLQYGALCPGQNRDACDAAIHKAVQS